MNTLASEEDIGVGYNGRYNKLRQIVHAIKNIVFLVATCRLDTGLP